VGLAEVLKTLNLSKTYFTGKVTVSALKDINLTVAKGEFVAVMGPSGSGKSTLMHLLGALDTASSGKIFLRQKEITNVGDRYLTLVRREQVSFIFQFFNLIPTLTAEENITLPLLIAGKKQDAGVKQRLEELLSLVGLTNRRHHLPDELSGGEQQRVAIARALITQPDIILADEPTGNLDRANGLAVLNLLKRSAQELGQTIIMVTHDVLAATFAQRVIFLRDGEILKELTLGGADDKESIIACLKELEI